MSQDQKNNVFWVYTVNNEMSDKGAQNLLLKKMIPSLLIYKHSDSHVREV